MTTRPDSPPADYIESITIERIESIGHWRWKLHTDERTCALCYCPLEACCPECSVPGRECPVVSGKCLHSFHDHCLAKCLENKQECPYCREKWELYQE